MPYEVWWDSYNHMSGGVRALHVLRDELLARGQEAWMLPERAGRVPTVGIYPEVVPGNPGGYDRYVRWLLNRADFPGDECWAWETGMGDHPLLTVDIIERDLWTPYKGHRSGTAFWVGKGKLDRSVLPHDCMEISRGNFPDRTVLAEFVRSIDLLISFDPFTALTAEATCAGTPVLVHSSDPFWTAERVAAQGWYRHGVAWSVEELPHARETVHLAFDHYDALRSVFAERIDRFVEATS